MTKGYLLFVLLQKQDFWATADPPLYLALYWPEQKHFPCIWKFTIPLQSSINSASCGFPQFSGHMLQSRKGRGHCPAGHHPMALHPWAWGAHQWNPSADRDTGPLCAWIPPASLGWLTPCRRGVKGKGLTLTGETWCVCNRKGQAHEGIQGNKKIMLLSNQ